MENTLHLNGAEVHLWNPDDTYLTQFLANTHFTE